MAKQNTEVELVAAAREIGGIADCAAWVTKQMAAEIEAAGATVMQLTVADLLSMVGAHCYTGGGHAK